MVNNEQNSIWVKEYAMTLGGDIVGIANIDSIKNQFLLSPFELDGLQFGISVGIALSPAVLDGITDQPTLLYKWHYRQTNNQLDRLAFQLTQMILKKGFRALPIPASQVVDWDKQRGHLSHRVVAEIAGLGWRGRNNLLVNEKLGSQVRLVTVLTDFPLQSDSIIKGECGDCYRCVEVCPVKALGESPDDYDFEKCFQLLKSFSNIRGIGQHICGICVKACHGKNQNHE